ncbi:hypothetical protein M5362_07435 [Streptomyces sp. Je 1-79]|nr:hypothetical protein [Streptomyces sp. Je 1-79]MCT4352959.1 hypothetical protein [Streptomyces sp. Je 1-79]
MGQKTASSARRQGTRKAGPGSRRPLERVLTGSAAAGLLVQVAESVR